MQNYKEKESLKENQTAPKINEVSKKIMEEKNNNNKDPVYQRLYNLRASKEEKQIITSIHNENAKLKAKNSSQEKNKKLKNKSTTHHSKNISCNINNELENNENQEKEEVIYKTVNTEENAKRKSLNVNNLNNNNNRKMSNKKIELNNNFENNNNFNYEVKSNIKKNEKAKDLQYQTVNKNPNFKNPLDNSNKFLFNKYTTLFRSVFEDLFNEFINSGIEMDYTKGVNKDFLLQFFYKLKLFNLENNSNANNDNNNENNKFYSNEELISLIKPQEINLFEDIHENICDSEGYISIDHFYIFSLAILDLLDYYILKAFQDKEKENEKSKNQSNTPNKINNVNNNVNENKLDKNGNLIIDKNLIDKINSELKSKIILSKKYGGYDDANNFIITFEQSKKIHKDFLCFSTNWYKSIRNIKNKAKEIESLAAESTTFKPKINPKSAKIGEEYRRKIISELDIEMKNRNNQNLNNLDYIEILNLKKKRQEK